MLVVVSWGNKPSCQMWLFQLSKKTTLWSVLFPVMRDSWRSWGAFSKRRPPACSARRRPRPLQKEMPMPGTAGWFGSGNGSKHVKTFQRCPKKIQYRLNLKSDRYELPHTFHLFKLIYPSNILVLLAMANAYVRCLGFMFLFEGQDVGMGKACQALTSWVCVIPRTATGPGKQQNSCLFLNACSPPKGGPSILNPSRC